MVQAFGAVTFGLTVAALSASAGGVWLSIRLARKAGVMDVPNERSSHSVPTPRMGGVPMAASAMIAFGIWAYLLAGEVFPFKGIASAFLFAFGMFILGFCDDLFGLSPLLRFAVQYAVAVSCLGLAWRLLPGVPWIDGEWSRLPWAFAGAFWCVWMLNLYNFMDGIDGLAGGEAAVASAFFFLLFAREGESGWAVANLLVAASAMGFLVHNWPPARVFMGDAGSAFLGAFYGMQSVLAPLSTKVPFIVLVLPFANFILDTTVTLIRRFLRGEKWYQAHRSHFYQRMTNIGMSHKKVTLLELLSVAVCCFAAEICLRTRGMGRVSVTAIVLVAFVGAGMWVDSRNHGAASARP
jgi:UDP-N-acetylmuramyl pentapeptide phosphotransferase/UDP-N-acetylglucosamine-1-phosphate transferase